MTKIRYIGLKPVKEDNVAKTGLLWSGNGDVQEVADPAAAAKLLAHPQVWEEATDDAKPAAPEAGTKTKAQQVAELDALRKCATALGVDVKGTWGAARLTKEIEGAEAARGNAPEGGTGSQA